MISDSPPLSGRFSRRQFLGIGARAMVGACGAHCLGQASGRPPNVVLIVADDLGWHDPACYGHPRHETPALDRLAREGARFTDAYAAAPVCSPTRASLLTGKYPARLGMTHITQRRAQATDGWQEPANAPQLALAEVTLAERLKQAGYATASIGKWHLGGGAFEPRHQGFDCNVAGGELGQPPDYFFPYRRTLADGRVVDLPQAPAGGDGDYLDEVLTAAATAFIAEHRELPFFLYMSFFLPHTAIGARLQARADKIEKYRIKAGAAEPDKPHLYAAMVEHLDDCVGQLLRQLAAAGIADDTLVIFTSDNGGFSGSTNNQPLRGAKGEAYEGGIRVPTIMRWPGHIGRAAVVAEPIITPDLCATVLDAAGLPAVQPLDGVSLLPLLGRGQRPERDAIYWHYPHFSPQAFSAIRAGAWKLIEFFGEAGTRHELYHLAEDIGERRNLAATMPELTRNLQSRLARWRESVGARMPVRRPA